MADHELPAIIEGLDVNEVRDGLIAYDPSRDRVHYLNATAAIVFVLCDGATTVEQMATQMQEAFGLDHPAVDEVRAGLESLGREGLLA